MPVPGPRVQTGPLPGYDNPGLESPDRINPWKWPGTVSWPGRSPGTMIVNLRGNILGHGQVRRLWKQAVNLIPAQAAYSWSQNSPAPGRPVSNVGLFEISRAIRYKTQSFYAPGGDDNTRFAGLHTVIPKKNRSPRVTLGTGVVRNQPTVRNRISSFGSRVPTLNQPIEGAEPQ